MSNVNIGTKMRTLDVGRLQPAYTGVIIHSGQNGDGQEIDYSVGDDTGSVLEVTVPNGSFELAYALLDKLKLRGYQYQPFEADGAIAGPAIEIGDNITANNVPSIVMGIQTNHSRLMASTLKAPFDEEVNHEWKYVPRSERKFKRESAYTRSRLTITDGRISAEAIRAKDAENVLSGRIDVNVDRIEAKVSKSGGNSSSFGWTLTDSSWTLTSNNSTVLKATSAGIEVSGKITATSGYIGNGSSGFEIGNNYIRNGMTSLSDTTHSGVYVGTDGIALGSGAFKVTSAGALTAKSGDIAGFGFDYNSFSKSTPDVSTSGDTQHQVMLYAPSSPSIWDGALYIRHREYDGSSYGSWVNDFLVQYNGRVTASDLHINGGEISIGNNFRVDSSGNLTANTGTFKGDVYAGSILSGSDYGYLSGSGLSDYSIGYSKYGIGSVYGGVDEYGSPTGSLAAYTVAYGNSGFTSTLDQVGTNASNISSLSNSLADKRSISNCNFDNLYLLKEGYYHSLYADYITIGGTSRKVVFWN